MITVRVANSVAKHRAVVESSLENLSHAEIRPRGEGDAIRFHADVRNAMGSGNGAAARVRIAPLSAVRPIAFCLAEVSPAEIVGVLERSWISNLGVCACWSLPEAAALDWLLLAASLPKAQEFTPVTSIER